jgi:hypothetical protein
MHGSDETCLMSPTNHIGTVTWSPSLGDGRLSDASHIDVAARVGPLPLHFPEQTLISHLERRGRQAVTFGQTHFRIWKHPLNDSRSRSRFTLAAASNISDRITKWPSDNA